MLNSHVIFNLKTIFHTNRIVCVYAAINWQICPLGPPSSGTFTNSVLREEYQSAFGKRGILWWNDIHGGYCCNTGWVPNIGTLLLTWVFNQLTQDQWAQYNMTSCNCPTLFQITYKLCISVSSVFAVCVCWAFLRSSWTNHPLELTSTAVTPSRIEDMYCF